jgi:C-terminal processing protease CtpA/Prc
VGSLATILEGGFSMSTTKISLTTAVLLSLLTVWGCQSPGNRTTETQDTSGSQIRLHKDDAHLPKGVIGVSMHVGADRVGDTASLYVAHVHPEGPARQAGIKHGDEVVTVNGAPVTGKTYDQVIQMVRGEAGTEVKLGVRRGEEVREIAIVRVPRENLYKG